MEIIDQVSSLELRVDNPYSIGEILTIDDELFMERSPISYSKSNSDRYYTTEQNETFQSVAFDAWGNSKNWWILWDLNEQVENPFLIPPGTTLLVPDIDNLFSPITD